MFYVTGNVKVTGRGRSQDSERHIVALTVILDALYTMWNAKIRELLSFFTVTFQNSAAQPLFELEIRVMA